MRQLIVTEFMTLDGVVEAPGGGDHPHAGWTFRDIEFDPAAYEIKGAEQEQAAAVLVGRRSWQEFAPVWPSMTEFARYNELPKYVVSTTLEQTAIDASPWQPMTLLGSLDEVRALKEGDGGPILVHGSPTLAQSLLAGGLVDRYHLLVFPLVLGSGTRLFADDGTKHKLSVIESQTYANGVTKLVLDVD